MANFEAVLKHLNDERRRIDGAIAAIEGINGKSLSLRRTGKRKLSAAARESIAAAQRKRWKLWKAQQKKAA